MTEKIISIDRLKKGFIGLSPTVGSTHAEACLVCLNYHKHESGIDLTIQGGKETELLLRWDDDVTEQISRTWNDLPIATEWAACGIAFLVVEALFGYTVVRQSKKGDGFDYWLGKQDKKTLLIQETARLEVSGILNAETQGIIRARVKQKIEQVKDGELPAHIIVVEFSRPIAWIEQKDEH